MSDTSENFNWADVHECIVQQSVERVAIYSNPHDDIVIRQERRWDEEENTFIVIARGQALVAAYAILEAGGEGDICFHRACGGGFEDVSVPIRPSAMMAARPDIDSKAVNEDFNKVEADVSEQKSKDPTAAERMRRYRQKHRNDRNDERNAVTDEPELQLVNCTDQQEEVLHAAE